MKKLIIYVFAFLCLSVIGCQKDPSEISTPPFQVYNSPATLAKPTPDHGFIVSSNNGTNWEFRKISEDGTELWTSSISPLQLHKANASFQIYTPSIDGGCLIFGEYFIDTSTYNRSVTFMLKIESNGSISQAIAIDTLLTAGTQNFYLAAIGNDGDYILIKNVKTATSLNYLIRIDSEGKVLTKFLVGYYSVVKKIIELPDKNILILSGNGSPQFGVSFHYYLDKINPDGINSWRINLNVLDDSLIDIGKMVLNDLTLASDGMYYLTGHTNELNNNSVLDYDFFLKKINPNGVVVDSVAWPGLSSEYCKVVTLANDGSLYLSGVTCSSPPIAWNSDDPDPFGRKQYKLSSRVHIFILKLDPQLNPIWKKSFGNNFGSECIGVQETIGGNILLIGNKIGFRNKNIENLFSLRIDADGNEY